MKKILTIAILAVLLVGCFSTIIKADVAPTLNDGLILYYNFDEGSGTIAIDHSGENNHGTISNSQYINGVYGSALKFDADSDYVTTPLSFNCQTTEYTVTAWVNVTSAANDGSALFCNGGTSYIYFIQDNGVKSICVYPNGHTFGTITFNVWHLVTYISNSSGVFAYLDGTYFGTYASAFPNVDELFGVAHGWSATNCFHGEIDEVRFYNRVLSQTEITYLYENPQPTPTPSATPTPTTTNNYIGISALALFTLIAVYFITKPQSIINFVIGILTLGISVSLAAAGLLGGIWMLGLAGAIIGILCMLRGTDLL